MKKLSNLSLYDIRKAARNAQNTLFAADSTPFELELRAITTNDPWGPSTKQLNGLLDISIQDIHLDSNQQTTIIFERIAKYLNPDHEINDRRHRTNSISNMIYNAAVNYVNQGNEWRIVNKCLKVLEFLVLHSPSTDDIVKTIGSNQIYLEQIKVKYQKIIDEDTKAASNDATGVLVTSKVQEIDNLKAVIATSDRLLKLYKDSAYRSSEIQKALKLANTQSDSLGNDVKLRKVDDTPTYEKSFKTKKLDRFKVENSNIKSKVRNDLNHVFHDDNTIVPGTYSQFRDDGTISGVNNNSLIDYDTDVDEEDEEEVDPYLHKTLHSAEYDDDEFGEFEKSPKRESASTDQDLIDFRDSAAATTIKSSLLHNEDH